MTVYFREVIFTPELFLTDMKHFKIPKTKWRSIIAECESKDATQLTNSILESCPNVQILATVFDIPETLTCIRELEPNLIFLNVTLRDGSGFDVLDQLVGIEARIVLLAPHEGFAIQALRSRAFDYLTKPISPETMEGCMARLDQLHKEFHPNGLPDDSLKFNYIFLNEIGVRHMVKVEDICHLQGDGNYSTVLLLDGSKFTVSKPLKHFENILPAKLFFRVHQSHLINIKGIESLVNSNSHGIQLKHGRRVPIARRKKEEFFQWLNRV